MNTRIEQMMKVQSEGLELFRKKNTDYGDSFATYGPIGVIIRMGDKISRLNSVTNSGINLVNTESVRDTLIDLHNYAAMAIMLIDEKPGDKQAIQHKQASQDNSFKSEYPDAPTNVVFSDNNSHANSNQQTLPLTTVSNYMNNRTPSPGPRILRRNSWTTYPFENDSNFQEI